MLFLFLKFVLGTASFVLVSVLGPLSLGFIAVPLYYDQPDVFVGITGVVQVETLPDALGVAVVGFLLLVVSLHVFNLAARLSGRIAKALLAPGDLRPV
ncbi:integral membrane sensor signal transduction histidine kinase [Haloferax mucosum ATCC BAA-1512]|uniref:Integral membrane sensor signal transduction histidine kinase n=2 Tax=Haloferax mucosum TaxID=403181 RepID=M0ILY7_9EURY|nr:integral membrane sensor signal transduction histidine kinase [Haloferax mucosum ATCC BAA-1512]